MNNSHQPNENRPTTSNAPTLTSNDTVLQNHSIFQNNALFQQFYEISNQQILNNLANQAMNQQPMSFSNYQNMENKCGVKRPSTSMIRHDENKENINHQLKRGRFQLDNNSGDNKDDVVANTEDVEEELGNESGEDNEAEDDEEEDSEETTSSNDTGLDGKKLAETPKSSVLNSRDHASQMMNSYGQIPPQWNNLPVQNIPILENPQASSNSNENGFQQADNLYYQNQLLFENANYQFNGQTAILDPRFLVSGNMPQQQLGDFQSALGYPQYNNYYQINNNLVVSPTSNGLMQKNNSENKLIASTPATSGTQNFTSPNFTPIFGMNADGDVSFQQFLGIDIDLNNTVNSDAVNVNDSGIANRFSEGSSSGGSLGNSSNSVRSSDGDESKADSHSIDNLAVAAMINRTNCGPPVKGTVRVDPSLKYCSVPGRLALLSNSKKYNVTIGEIWRRINPPECLNASFLGGILRKAKNRNGGTELRTTLQSYGMQLPAGRRKSSACTTFTALCEEEAVQMSRDFATIASETFPTQEIAQVMTRNMYNANDALLQVQAIEKATMILKEAFSIVHANEMSAYDISSPRPHQSSREEEAHFAVRNGVVRFSRLTHGFGNETLLASWNVFGELLTRLKLMVEKKFSMSVGEQIEPQAPKIEIKNEFLQHQQSMQLGQPQNPMYC